MNIIEQVKQKLVEEIKKSIQQEQLADVNEIPEIKIEIPKDNKNGDYSTNIAMVLKKIAKRNQRKIETENDENLYKTAEQVEKDNIEVLCFINFYLDSAYLTAIITEAINNGDQFGHKKVKNGENILLEYVSANPTGDLHIGHARNAAVGDTLANILEAA